MKTLIVLNQTDVAPLAQDFDFIVGVDGGCQWCIENQINIDLAIGDFDSLEQCYFDQLDQHAKLIEKHPSDKDLTDLELAIRRVVEKNAISITALGIWGGRLDHSLANLLCLARQSESIPVTMPAIKQIGHLLKSKQSIVLQPENEQIISILALLEDCHGVSNTGMKYPLKNATIKVGSGFGISNQTISNPCDVSVEKGVLLVLTDSNCKTQICKNVTG